MVNLYHSVFETRRKAFSRGGRRLQPHWLSTGRQARGAGRDRGRPGRGRRVSRRNTSGRSSRMPAWARPAPWSMRGRTARPCGPARKSRISRATGSPARSVCRRTRCTGSGSRARAPTAATTPATPGSTRHSVECGGPAGQFQGRPCCAL